MLRLDNIVHIYTGAGLEARTVLSIASWSVGSGDQILLRGVSGSGKTTLFNIAAGLLRPTQGEVVVDAGQIYHMSEAERDRFRAARIGYVFQNHQLMPGFSALENVVMPMMFARVIPTGQRRERGRSLLAQVGLADFARHRPNQLSTGQRLRVGIARALANEPKLVLADEPTAALDSDSAASVMDFLQQTCKALGAALIVASHDPALAVRFPLGFDLRAGSLSQAKDAAA